MKYHISEWELLLFFIFLYFMWQKKDLYTSNCFSVVRQGPFTYVFLTNIINPHDHIIAILIGSAFPYIFIAN